MVEVDGADVTTWPGWDHPYEGVPEWISVRRGVCDGIDTVVFWDGDHRRHVSVMADIIDQSAVDVAVFNLSERRR